MGIKKKNVIHVTFYLYCFLGSANTSLSDGPTSPLANTENSFGLDQMFDSESLRLLLNEVCTFSSDLVVSIYERR